MFQARDVILSDPFAPLRIQAILRPWSKYIIAGIFRFVNRFSKFSYKYIGTRLYLQILPGIVRYHHNIVTGLRNVLERLQQMPYVGEYKYDVIPRVVV